MIRVALACIALTPVSCGDGGDEATTRSTSTTSTTGPVVTQPPSETPEGRLVLERFGSVVEPLGLTITRAALAEESGAYSARGRHLAVYLTPTSEFEGRRYIENIVPLVTAFVPEVFQVLPGIESFDVCQEPFTSDETPPPPMTQVAVMRSQLHRLDWDTAALSTLVAGSRARPNALGLAVAKSLEGEPLWVEAAGS